MVSPGPGRRDAVWVAAWALTATLAACRPTAPYLLVTLDAAPGTPSITLLHVVVTIDAGAAAVDIPSGGTPFVWPRSFSIELPASTRGRAQVAIEGRDAGGLPVAQVSGEATISGNGTERVDLTFGQAPPDLLPPPGHYVAPTGTTSTAPGTGTFANPWTLETALAAPAAVQPGDTIWLRGGTYRGAVTSTLRGTAATPIVVRQYPGERATLDGGDTGGAPIVTICGAYTWFWGFEITSSDPTRQSSQAGPGPTDLKRGTGVAVSQTAGCGVGTRLINLVIHDTRQGVDFGQEAVDGEVYGSLLYYNGWDGTDRGYGDGLFAQNQTGSKHLSDNIVFHNFGNGIEVVGSSTAFLDGITIEGTTLFRNDDLSAFPNQGREILFGGAAIAHDGAWIANMTWNPIMDGIARLQSTDHATLTDNYLVEGAKALEIAQPATALTMEGNTFYAMYAPDLGGLSQAQFPNNAFLTQRPTGTKVFVRPNKYEPGRANITIYDWDVAPTVAVDVSGVLTVGARYEVRNAADFFGAPVASGTYDGMPLALPTGGLSVAAPVGVAAPMATGREFNAFVLVTL